VKAGIGFSRVPSSKKAGAEAAREAGRLLEKPALTFLFTTEGYDQKEVLEGVLSQTGATCLGGACGAGIVTPQGIYREGVAVLALGGDGISAVTDLVAFVDSDPKKTGKRLGNNLLGKASVRTGTVFVFPDGLANHISEMLCGLYDVLGPEFQYVGGGTGDNLRFMKTYQMTEHGVASSSVAAALVAGCSFGIGIGHGWKSVGAPLIITKARGRVLYELDEQPAFEVYSRRLGGLTPENFAEVGAKHPLGITDASGRFIIRGPLWVLPGGAIQLVTDVPSRAVAYLMTAEREDLLRAARDVATTALQAVRVPRFALVFDCVSRSLLLGNGCEEVAIIRETLGPLPFVGFLTFGEVAPYDDVPLFHNKSLVIAVGGE
jgi:hypothetical protein